jgi:hypothetical protein
VVIVVDKGRNFEFFAILFIENLSNYSRVYRRFFRPFSISSDFLSRYIACSYT